MLNILSSGWSLWNTIIYHGLGKKNYVQHSYSLSKGKFSSHHLLTNVIWTISSLNIQPFRWYGWKTMSPWGVMKTFSNFFMHFIVLILLKSSIEKCTDLIICICFPMADNKTIYTTYFLYWLLKIFLEISRISLFSGKKRKYKKFGPDTECWS